MAWGCLQEASGAAPGWWRLPHIDKLAHAGMHGLLAWLLWRGLGRRATLRTGVAIIALCAGYGLAIEGAQWQFTATRSAEALDALANALGAVLGVALAARGTLHCKPFPRTMPAGCSAPARRAFPPPSTETRP